MQPHRDDADPASTKLMRQLATMLRGDRTLRSGLGIMLELDLESMTDDEVTTALMGAPDSARPLVLAMARRMADSDTEAAYTSPIPALHRAVQAEAGLSHVFPRPEE